MKSAAVSRQPRAERPVRPVKAWLQRQRELAEQRQERLDFVQPRKVKASATPTPGWSAKARQLRHDHGVKFGPIWPRLAGGGLAWVAPPPSAVNAARRQRRRERGFAVDVERAA